MGRSVRDWWRDLSNRFMDAYFKAISRGIIGAPPRVSDRDPVRARGAGLRGEKAETGPKSTAPLDSHTGLTGLLSHF